MRLTKKLFYQGKQTRLLSTKLSWCPIKTNQTRLSSTSEFGLSCSLSTNPTVIFDCLTCLVRCQPIPPSYLIVWFALFVVNQPNRHIWRLDLSCCYPPSYSTARSVLFVTHQFLLIITIAFKRGKQHQCRYIRFNGGLLCHFNPLKAVLSDCSHCFQKNWAHQCRCIRNNAGLLCRLISWKQCQSFMSPFPVWRKQYSMIIT